MTRIFSISIIIILLIVIVYFNWKLKHLPKSTLIIKLDDKTIKANINPNDVNDTSVTVEEGFTISKPQCKTKIMDLSKIIKYGASTDYRMKGANYVNYDKYISPIDSGVRILPKDNTKLYPKYSIIPKFPQSKNYVFD